MTSAPSTEVAELDVAPAPLPLADRSPSVNGADLSLAISTFTGARDNRPQPMSLEWRQLVAKLRNVRRTPCSLADCPGKECPHKQCAAWSPATYPLGATRAKKNVDAVSVLVLDHDNISDEQILEIEFKLRHHRRVLHATHSDRPGARCIRSVIEISRAVPGAQWPKFWRSVVAALSLPGVDTQACDASRLYFAPSRPSDAPYFFHAAEARR